MGGTIQIHVRNKNMGMCAMFILLFFLKQLKIVACINKVDFFWSVDTIIGSEAPLFVWFGQLPAWRFALRTTDAAGD